MLLLSAIMALLSDTFLTFTNLVNVGTQIAVIAILALGSTFVIIAGGIDLSGGSVLALAGIVFGRLVVELPLPVAVLAALGVGALAGLTNGLLITIGKLPPFIATLAMLSAARGLALVISGGIPLSQILRSFRTLGSGDPLNISLPVLLMVAV